MVETVLARLLGPIPELVSCTDVEAWWRGHRSATAGHARPIERAMIGGFVAREPGAAFASGYQEAMRALAPALGDARAALCNSEPGGGHPAAITTRLDADGLTGTKQFVLLGAHAERLLIVASTGLDDQGRNRLAVVDVPASRAGLSWRPLTMPYLAEVPAASLRLDRVAIEPAERLPGDGYATYVKPFRTIEDLHVNAALLAWHLQVARRAGWPRGLIERMVASLAAIHALADASPSSPSVHVALAGVLAEIARLLGELEPHWPTADADSRARWQRDRAVLALAGQARARRLDAAWQRLAG